MKTKGKGTLQECPVCKSTDISGGNFETSPDFVWQRIECDKCNSAWFEDYESVGWELVTNGKTKKEYNL